MPEWLDRVLARSPTTAEQAAENMAAPAEPPREVKVPIVDLETIRMLIYFTKPERQVVDTDELVALGFLDAAKRTVTEKGLAFLARVKEAAADPAESLLAAAYLKGCIYRSGLVAGREQAAQAGLYIITNTVESIDMCFELLAPHFKDERVDMTLKLLAKLRTSLNGTDQGS